MEGGSPYGLAPGRRGDEDEVAEDASDSDEEAGAAAGTVYRLARGIMKKLEGGMEQYEQMAARNAAKLGKASGT